MHCAGRLSGPASPRRADAKHSQSDCRRAIGPFSPFRLGRPYKRPLEPDGSPLHSLPDFWHDGGHNWTQPDAAGGPIDEVRGTSFVLVGDGTGWCASYDGLSAGTDPDATVELNRSFWRIRDSVSSWPERGDGDCGLSRGT